MTEPLAPSTGLGVLHLFARLDGVSASPGAPSCDTQAVVQAVKSAEADGVQVVVVAMLGHKADVGFMALGADLWRLRRLQTDLQAAGLSVVYSYISLTEVSEYAAGIPDEMKQTRLYPSLPPEGMTAFCFYPMSKRRGESEGSNWFSMPFEERKAHDARTRGRGPHLRRTDRPGDHRIDRHRRLGVGRHPVRCADPTT